MTDELNKPAPDVFEASRTRRSIRAYRATNYDFFGAPAGLVFTIDRRLEKGSWLDYGMFLD